MVISRILQFQISPSPHLFYACSPVRGCSIARPPFSNHKGFIKANESSDIKNVACRTKFNSSIINGRFNKWKSKSSISENSITPEAEDHILIKVIRSLKIFYAFTRPYACIGTILNVISSSLMAIESLSDISLPFVFGLLKAATAFYCVIVYTNGINQIFDIEIDKVNKPYLPLASKEMTIKASVAIISASALMAFAVPIIAGSRPLFWGILLDFLIFTAYSMDLPLLRWKNTAIGAAFSILAGFAIVMPLASYLHMQTFVLGRQAKFSGPLAFGIIALNVFYAVIALFKDVPDIEGDKKFGVHSLAVHLGQKQVFWICVYLLQMFYAYAIVTSATFAHSWRKLIIILSHIVLSSILWKKAKSTDLRTESLASFYMFVWKLLYAEYFIIPLVR